MTLPGIITREGLFEVQRRALEEAGDKAGFAYFMEQGLGKTRTVLHEFHEKVTRDLADVLVVTCPMSLRGAWRDECEECGYPYEVVIIDQRISGAEWGYPQYPVIVTNEKRILQRIRELRGKPFILVFHYELVLSRGHPLIEHLVETGKRIYWALDESVRIKNHESKVGERLYFDGQGKERIQKGIVQSGPKKGKPKYIVEKVRDPVAYRRVLSGTPAPQGMHDMWGQLRFIGWVEQVAYYAFRHLYCKMGGFMAKKVVGIKNLDVFKLRYEDAIFRAKKEDWTDLPEKLWAHPREVELTPRQRRSYLEIMHEMVLEIGPDQFITAEMAVTIKGKLQQICSGWIYDNEHNAHELVPLAENPKFQDLREWAEGFDSKGLIFYFFKPTRDLLEQWAEKYGFTYVFLESGLKMEEFERRKKLFNEDPSVQFAFCQTDAVKEGHTLLGTPDRRCYSTYFLENTYSLYARSQGEDRNHRHGQTNPVTYYDVVTSKEDKTIIKALQTKKSLQEALLSEFTAYREKKGSLQLKAA